MHSTDISNIKNNPSEVVVAGTKEKQNGWQQKGTSWYYYKDNKEVTGWLKDNDKWYYMGDDGKMRTGWIKENDQWYYLNDDGTMAINITIDGYYLNEKGLIKETSKQKSNFQINNFTNNSTKENNKIGSIVQDSTEAKEIIYNNDSVDYELAYKGIYSSREINDELSELYENFIIREPVHVFYYYNEAGNVTCIYYVGKNTGTLYRRDGGYYEITNAYIIKENQIVRVYNYRR